MIKISSRVGVETGEAQEIAACPGLEQAASWPFDWKGSPFSSPHTLSASPLRVVWLFRCPIPLILTTLVGQAEQTLCAH